MKRTGTGLFIDTQPGLSSLNIHTVPAPAIGSQANVSCATQTVHHGEDLIPRDIRAKIEKLVQQKTGLIGKHPEYSMSAWIQDSSAMPVFW